MKKTKNKFRVKIRKTKRRLKREKLRSCYGSREYSPISYICRDCEWRTDCGKIKFKIARPNRWKIEDEDEKI